MKQFFPSSTGGVELFDEFFDSGLEESVSPFLYPRSRRWGINLSLKASLAAAFLLFGAYLFSFFPRQLAVSNLLLLFTFFLAGIPALITSVEDLFNFEINIDVLMTLAAFLSILIGSGKEGALLLVLFSFSGAMEDAVRTKAKGALASLKKLSPQKAFVIEPDGSMHERSVKDISIGTVIHVKAGQIVPLDGNVIEGASFLNQVHLTGESVPVSCKIGDNAPAGARNLEGALTLEVTRTSSDSTLARIIQLIVQAQEAKPKLQRWLDTVSNRYAMGIISLAFLFALSFPFLFSMPFLGREGSIYRALTFLIAASPCALIIAIPIAYLSAVSACAKQGILLKGGVMLDALARCKTIAMDKTGTLTTGELACLDMKTFGDPGPLLAIAYTLERSAVHPIAHAIVAYSEKHGIKPLTIKDFVQIPGYGVQGSYQDYEAFIGLPAWILPKIPAALRESVEKEIEETQVRGELYTLLTYRSSVALFRFNDELRPGIAKVIKDLQDKEHLNVVVLSGDHQFSVREVAKKLGIHEYHAELRPEDKMKYISHMEDLAMVGDGINDAPALARANVGISMGKVGSTTAVDASDIVLLQDNIELLAWLVKKSRQVVHVVKQNVCVALAAILFATFPALMGWIPLWLAVILHEGGTVIVGLNALRLLKKGKGYGKPTTSRPSNGSN